MTSKWKRSRVWTALRVIASVLALTITFAVAAAFGVLLHLDRPATRRMVALQVNGVLRGALEGDVRIERIASLGIGGIEGLSASVRDPSGLEVLHVEGVNVHVRGIAAARSALFGSGPIRVDVPSVRVGHADTNLDTDADGNLRIANAFVSRSPSSPPSPNDAPGRGVVVDVPKVQLGHAWVHGVPSSGLIVDADLWDLAARASVEPSVTRAELADVHFVTRALPQHANPKGAIRGTFATPAPNGQGFEVEAVFSGEAVGVPTTLEAKMVDRRLDVRLDANGEPVGDTGEFVMAEPMRIHAEAHGDLPEIEANLRAAVGESRLSGKAVVVAARTTRIAGELAAREINLAKLASGAPVSKLGLDARADLVLDERGVFGKAAVDTLPGVVDGRTVPPVTVRGAFEGLAAAVRATVVDPSFPTEVAVDVTARGGNGRTVSGSIRSRIPDLQRLPVVGARLTGSAEASAALRVALPENAIESSSLHVEIKKLKAESLGLGTIALNARASGTIEHPVVDAAVHAGALFLGSLPFASLDAKARVERQENAISVSDAQLKAVREPLSETVTASARLVRIAKEGLRASGVEIHGLGEPVHAELLTTRRDIRGRIDAPSINLPLVARLLGKDSDLGVKRGAFGIQGEGEFRGGVAKAKVHAEIRDLAMRDVHGGQMRVDGSIDGRDVALDLMANVGKAGQVAVRTDRVVLGGPVDSAGAWKGIAGKVHVTANIDMAHAARWIPPERLPVADLHGNLTVQGRVGRDSKTAPPEVQLHLHTVGFGFAGRAGEGEQVSTVHVEKASPLRASDFDVGLDVRNDGPSGLTNVAFHATDRHGVIVAVDAKAILPYEEWLRDANRGREVLAKAPFGLKVSIPPRKLDELPPILAGSGVSGTVALDVDASGSVVAPRIVAVVRAEGMRAAALPSVADADADLRVEYDGSIGALDAKMRSGGKELADVTGRAEIRARDLLVGRRDLPWKASVRAKLASFPLESVPQLQDRRIRGNVSGQFELAGLHENAVAKGQLDFERLAVGDAEYRHGKISIDTTGHKLVAAVRLEQNDGDLDLKATSGLAWGKDLAPTLDDGQPITARLSAHAFRAAAIQPFVEGAAPVLDGRIDANATAKLVPGKAGAALDGTVDFHDGKVLVAALGEELRGVKATVRFLPDGTIRVTDAGAKGAQGELRADANVKLEGTRVAGATANVRIPKDKPLSLALQGSPIGELAGTITLKAKQSPDGKDTALAVEIPNLGVELPQVTKTGLQTLEPKENIYVGVQRARHRFVTLPLDGTAADKRQREEGDAGGSRLEVDVRLGRIVIKRGNQLEVEVSGEPKVAVDGGETKVTGQVRLVRGWVDVHGKKFEVEKGTVTFNGESPPDPTIVVTAGWTAADGSRIYADFVGPVSSGKVTLRSEPPRPQNEILALVLFGTADGANPTPQQQKGGDGTAKTAVGLGGGYLAEGLTEALDDLGGVQATARIDTTDSNNPRPELSFQVSPKISVGFAHVVGTPPITEPDRNYANVEYRFRKNWSLQTTVGDRGSTVLDALWQKRY